MLGLKYYYITSWTHLISTQTRIKDELDDSEQSYAGGPFDTSTQTQILE